MKAVQLVAHGCPGRFRFGEVPDPPPGTGEAVLEVGACGLNRLDLWHEEGALPIPLHLPRIPGCEIAGRVRSVGAGVEDWKAGDRVAVQSNLFCGVCEFCRRGEESLCLSGEMLGVQRDGGFAAQVRHLTGKRGVDLVVEHVGGAVFEQLFNCLARGGTIVTCGATAGREVKLNLWPLFVKQQRIVGSYGRNRKDLEATLAGAAQGWLKPVIDRVVPLSETANAFAALRSRTVMGKIVVVPQPA